MSARFFILFAFLLSAQAARGVASYRDLDAPPHSYSTRIPRDRFTRLKEDLESGRIPLERTSEKAFVVSLLRALDVPVSSQMLVFSTTSLQLRLISPANPRALYFTDDLYVGYVPGGRIEILSLDPELGAVFYIFDIPTAGQPLRVERSDRCMNCHAGDDTGRVPGLVIKSVIPGPSGGSLTAFRLEKTGHGIPLEERFGGWYLTGPRSLPQYHANVIGRFSAGQLLTSPVLPGEAFDMGRYPVPTSGLLPQLLHEHQAGFVNRVVEASYRARTHLFSDGPQLTPEHAAELDEQARILTRYLLFADEVPLPPGGVPADPVFLADFFRGKPVVRGLGSLRDFELQRHLFKYRCSYMIYSGIFHGLPAEMRARVYRQLSAALSLTQAPPEFAYLAPAEKQTIHAILLQTLSDLPAGW